MHLQYIQVPKSNLNTTPNIFSLVKLQGFLSTSKKSSTFILTRRSQEFTTFHSSTKRVPGETDPSSVILPAEVRCARQSKAQSNFFLFLPVHPWNQFPDSLSGPSRCFVKSVPSPGDYTVYFSKGRGWTIESVRYRL